MFLGSSGNSSLAQLQIMNMDGLSVDHARPLANSGFMGDFLGRWYSSRSEATSRSIHLDDGESCIVCVTQSRSILSHRVKHRLNIRRRARDDAQISLVAVCCSSDSLSS